MDLIKNQKKLQEEARQVLSKLNLENLLKKIGNIEIIGSFELGLMVWRDIDLEVEVKKQNKNRIIELITDLLKIPSQRIDVSLIENTKNQKPKFPRGIYLGIKYFGNIPEDSPTSASDERVWKIDIWFVEEQYKMGSVATRKLKNDILEDQILPILTIKDRYYAHPKYKKVFTSMDIYEAVIRRGVRSDKAFLEFLKTKNIHI